MNGLIILSLPVSNPHFDSLVPFLVQRGSLLSDGWEQITVWYQTVLSIRISGVRIGIHYCNQNFFLTGEAAEWAKDNPLMQARITTQSPTNDGFQAIKQLMQDRFPQHFCEAHTFDINAKFGNLHQRLEETLWHTTNERASSMTKHVGVGDRKTGISLLLVEIAFLDGIIRSFVKSITNFSYEKEVARRLSSPARLFYLVHSIGEEAGQTKVQKSPN